MNCLYRSTICSYSPCGTPWSSRSCTPCASTCGFISNPCSRSCSPCRPCVPCAPCPPCCPPKRRERFSDFLNAVPSADEKKKKKKKRMRSSVGVGDDKEEKAVCTPRTICTCKKNPFGTSPQASGGGFPQQQQQQSSAGCCCGTCGTPLAQRSGSAGGAFGGAGGAYGASTASRTTTCDKSCVESGTVTRVDQVSTATDACHLCCGGSDKKSRSKSRTGDCGCGGRKNRGNARSYGRDYSRSNDRERRNILQPNPDKPATQYKYLCSYCRKCNER